MRPDDVQWLRAGRGVIHDEAPSEEMRRQGGRFRGVQLWINMPKANKHDEPSYRHVRAGDIPVLESSNAKARTRLVAGRLNRAVGPVATTGTPFVAHSTLSPGAVLDLSLENVSEVAAYAMVGDATIAGTVIRAGQLARLSNTGDIRVGSDAATEVLILGGDPVADPIHRYGPYVMNSVVDLERAVNDYRSGRMGFLAPSRTA
jgi:redox-sensitive bicupin YhaK (pirin superfamily)